MPARVLQVEEPPRVARRRLSNPPPTVELLDANLADPVLCVRPNCHNKDCWQVYFDTNRLIRETFGEAGFPAPEQHYAIRNPARAATA